MTRRKRKEANEGGVNENAPSVSNAKANRRGKVEDKSKTVNVDFDSAKSTRKSTRGSLQLETDQKSDANETPDRAGVRRSLRRPSSVNDETPTSVPPKKKVRRNTESNSNYDSSKSESQDGDRSNGSEEDVKQENHVASRRESRNERSRKRKLADINEEPTISAAVSTNDKKMDKPASDTESDMSETKRSVKGSKKRRKFSDSRNGRSSTEETDPVSELNAKEDSEYCQCAVPGYPGDAGAAEMSEVDEDWKNWSEYESDVSGDLLCNRLWKTSSKKSTDSDSCFSVLTYNILAESLLKTSHYFKRISPSHWNQKNRHKLLMKELKALNADILCLQEVENEYQPDLDKDLSSMGYNGFFACSESHGKTDGVAIFYRTSRFTDVAKKVVPFSQIADPLIEELNLPENQRSVIREYAHEPQMFQCIILKCKDTDNEVCVGNAHISYAKHKKPDLRCVQIARGIDQIMSFSASNREISRPMPFIFCGDFNSIPASAAYQLCRDGYLNDKMLNHLQESQNISMCTEKNKALVNVLWKAFQHPADDLQSCYFEVLNREPPMTLNLEGNAGCVDYLWYTKSNLAVDAVLIPRSSIIKRLTDSIPNAVFPSDHLSLCARLSFK